MLIARKVVEELTTPFAKENLDQVEYIYESGLIERRL